MWVVELHIHVLMLVHRHSSPPSHSPNARMFSYGIFHFPVLVFNLVYLIFIFKFCETYFSCFGNYYLLLLLNYPSTPSWWVFTSWTGPPYVSFALSFIHGIFGSSLRTFPNFPSDSPVFLLF